MLLLMIMTMIIIMTLIMLMIRIKRIMKMKTMTMTHSDEQKQRWSELSGRDKSSGYQQVHTQWPSYDHKKWGPSMTIISSSSIIIIWPSYHSYDHHIIIINDHHMTMKDRDESSGYQQIHTQHNDQYDHCRHTIIDMTSKEFFPSPFPQSLILLYSVRYILLAVFSLEHRLNTAGTKTKHDRDIDRWYSQHNT